MNTTQKSQHVSRITGMTTSDSDQWLHENAKRIEIAMDVNGWSMREALNWTLQHS